MLIQFSLENYLSFKQLTTLSLETGQRLRKYKESNTMKVKNVEILKNAIIFGANGSGKSNLFNGLLVMKKMLTKPTRNITEKLKHIPFLLDEDSKILPTTFEVEFFHNELFFKYGFSFVEDKILKEHLETKKNNKYETYFLREGEDFSYSTVDTDFATIIKKTRKNSLLLYNLQADNDIYATQVMEWFQNVLYFFDLDDEEKYYDLLKNDTNKQLFLAFLKAADFNIIDVDVQEDLIEISNEMQEFMGIISKNFNSDLFDIELPKKQLIKKLRTIYKKYNSKGEVIGTTSLNLGLESEGTKKVIKLALAVVYCQLYNRILILDEFDDSLHFNISTALIEVFNSKPNTNQFIFTTHELQLMDGPLRPDQIYLIQKDFTGESDLYSLFDFKDFNEHKRYDKSRFKEYLNGDFGAVPIIEIEELMAVLNKTK